MASTKEIPDMCFSEDVFASTQQGMFKKNIPCLNKHKYKTEVVPILETDWITKEGMTNLPCLPTHQMKARSTTVSENDNLYALYIQRISQDISFLRHWLKGSMLMHRKHFQRKAKNYLASKGLSIESWSKSVTDGRKADVLALFGLNLLLEMHTIVHLGNGKNLDHAYQTRKNASR